LRCRLGASPFDTNVRFRPKAALAHQRRNWQCGRTDDLTPLERAVVKAIAHQTAEVGLLLEFQLESAWVATRENTGIGAAASAYAPEARDPFAYFAFDRAAVLPFTKVRAMFVAIPTRFRTPLKLDPSWLKEEIVSRRTRPRSWPRRRGYFWPAQRR